MILSDEDAQLFFRLLFPLLDYVNERYGVTEMPKMEGAESIDFRRAYKVATRLWQEENIIPEYLARHPEFTKEEKEILKSWTRHVTGDFMVERHLKRGSVMIAVDYKNGYIVKGIVTPWSELIASWSLPAMIHTTLLPFKGRIVYDSMFQPSTMRFGSGVRNSLMGVYSELRKAGKVYNRL